MPPRHDQPHGNPLLQGGWTESGVGNSYGSPQTQSPASSGSSGNSSGVMAGPGGQWNPGQTIYGALPLGTPVGQLVLLFARRNPSDFNVVVAASRQPMYRIYTGGQQWTVISDAAGRAIARIGWNGSNLPIIERAGQPAPSLRYGPASNQQTMTVNTFEYIWSMDQRGFMVCTGRNNRGVSVMIAKTEKTPEGFPLILYQGTSAQELLDIVISFTAVQGQRFVGL